MDLKDIKNQSGLTYREMSELSGYSIGFLGDIFNGYKAPPIKDNKRNRMLVKALGIELFDLFKISLKWKERHAIKSMEQFQRKYYPKSVGNTCPSCGGSLKIPG